MRLSRRAQRHWQILPASAALTGWVVLSASLGHAQMSLPDAAKPDGAKLFKTQCATCHTLTSSEPQRQGPTLEKVVGRKAGSLPGYHYSAGFGKADWSWDESRLDAWLTNPQSVIPGSIMLYKQAKPETRAAIITYLKDLK